MKITVSPLPIKFIQIHRYKTSENKIKCFVYKFYSPKTKLSYIINVDEHMLDTYAIKFYCTLHKRSRNKYSLITNRGHITEVLITVSSIIRVIINEINPKANIVFSGAPTVRSRWVEDLRNNQRYRVYCNLVKLIIGEETFIHKKYEIIGGYALLNKLHFVNKEGFSLSQFNTTENSIKIMLQRTYPYLGEVE